MEKKLDGNYTRMLHVIWDKSWQQHSTNKQLNDHLPPISKTVQVRRTRHVDYCWRTKSELSSDVFLLTPTYECPRVGLPARTYISSVRTQDVVWRTCLGEREREREWDREREWRERERERERKRELCVVSATWWWCWWWCWMYVDGRLSGMILSLT